MFRTTPHKKWSLECSFFSACLLCTWITVVAGQGDVSILRINGHLMLVYLTNWLWFLCGWPSASMYIYGMCLQLFPKKSCPDIMLHLLDIQTIYVPNHTISQEWNCDSVSTLCFCLTLFVARCVWSCTILVLIYWTLQCRAKCTVLCWWWIYEAT